MVAGLEHPGIVAIHGAGMTPAGGVFLVMDLVRGQNLEQVYRSAQCDWNKAVAWIIEAAHIVNFANQHEVVHCDLKPSNLLLDDTGRIRATDFGLASRVSDAESKSLAGTPAFMAPEQVDRCWGEISPRTDVWGLGAVLFFLLSGRPPHCGSDVAEVLASVVSGTPVDFSWTKGSSAPQSVIDALRRCLAKSPADRYASALALANALADSVVA